MVYLRVKTFNRKRDKKQRTYYYLVDSKRENGKVKQQVLRYLGTANNIYEHYLESDSKAKG